MAVHMVEAEPSYINLGFEPGEAKRPPPFNPSAVTQKPQYTIEPVAPPPAKPKSVKKKKCINLSQVAVMVLGLGLCAAIMLAYYFLSPCGVNVVWCGDGLCVKQEEWCDGTAHCSSGQDEANCVRLSGDDFLLQAYSRSSQTWKSVCADDWTDEYGRQACEGIGYSRDTYVSSGQTPVPSSHLYSQGFMRLPSNTNPNIPLQANLQNSDTCPSGKTVTLRCIACGSKPSLSSDRVVGGQEAAAGAWPWQVMLMDNVTSTACGGAIIAPYWILTAAQCAQRSLDPSSWRVYDRIHGRMDYMFLPFKTVAHVVTFPDYDSKTHNNDISLMKLHDPFQISDSLRPICLPNVDMEFTPPQPSWIVGFGRTSEGGAAASKLMEAQVSLISRAKCNSPEVYDGKISDSMICAGNLQGGVDRCEGDEGGPLVTEKDSLWWLVGVTSWGQGCGRVNKPGVYGNVAYFLDWIYAEMKVKLTQSLAH
ncbi:transmembrane protease serine 2-like isoform X1 [Alosa sapidissima]|uniref:transmembrane protease serine 2-like isoform X1 n=1 Tax=Alosa sapidissima TaxID=34773 RepID=UPI001C084A97|nr:transmembrane protease serine 2-like isoform X1 [Alosa sapidissima]